MKYFLAALLFATELHAAPLTITPNGSATLVTAGIPFAACALADVANFRLLNERGEEVPVFIKPTLFWPQSRCSGAATVRAVKIQFGYDPGQGEATYDWQLAPRTLPDLQEAPVAEVAAKNPARAGYREPAFFAINDSAYLVTTGLISPTTVAGAGDYDRVWYPEAFAKRVSTIDFATTTGENWLFDSVSTIYQQALRTGSLEQYREAYLEHEFYMAKFEVKDQTTNQQDAGWIARWSMAQGDIKYVYLTPEKLHVALTGDDSWQPAENGTPHSSVADRTTFFKTVAAKAVPAQAIGRPYTNIGVRFTERESGFAFQQILAAYELTGDDTLLTALNTAVNHLYNMMTNNPDGRGNHGYLSHSWDSHEGDYAAYIGMSPVFTGQPATATQTFTEVVLRDPIGDDYTKMEKGGKINFKPYGPTSFLAEPPTKNADGTLTIKLTAPAAIRSEQWVMYNGLPEANTRTKNFIADRAFSPWMQAVMVDGLWQFYNLTGDVAVKDKVSEMLLSFGRAITAYAIDGAGLDPAIKAKIESAFGVTIVDGKPCCGRGISPYTRYVANAHMGSPEATGMYVQYMSYDGAFSDQHSLESLFQIAVALRFETDPAKKDAMAATAKALTGWVAAANVNRTVANIGTPRYFNWTNKSDPWGTYEAALQSVED